MRCKNCGQRLPEYAKICPMCKTPVTEEQRQQARKELEQGSYGRQDSQGGYGSDGWNRQRDFGYSKEGGWGRYPDSYGNQGQDSQGFNRQGQDGQGFNRQGQDGQSFNNQSQDGQDNTGWQNGTYSQNGAYGQNDAYDPNNAYDGGYEDNGYPYGGFRPRQPVGFAERLASMSLTFGIFNCIMTMVYPGVAIGLAIPGLVSAILGVRSERRYRAVAGIVLNVIAILIGICMQILLNALNSKM